MHEGTEGNVRQEHHGKVGIAKVIRNPVEPNPSIGYLDTRAARHRLEKLCPFCVRVVSLDEMVARRQSVSGNVRRAGNLVDG